MNSTTARYRPKGISRILNLPVLSESAPVTTSSERILTKEIEAYSMGRPEVESITEPFTTPMAGILPPAPGHWLKAKLERENTSIPMETVLSLKYIIIFFI